MELGMVAKMEVFQSEWESINDLFEIQTPLVTVVEVVEM